MIVHDMIVHDINCVVYLKYTKSYPHNKNNSHTHLHGPKLELGPKKKYTA